MPQIENISQSPPYPTNLPCDDGIPLETPIHRENMNILIDSTEAALGYASDFFAGGNMFLYYSPQEVKNENFRGPDFFLVKGVDGTKERDSWILWEENWKYPNIIVELLSESTYQIDLIAKKELYENTFRTPEYFVYDPKEPSCFQGWRLNKHNFYVELVKNEKGWLWSEEVNCWLGVWSGKLNEKFRTYLRMYDINKNLVLLKSEKERLEKEKERERAERERLEKEKERERAERERLEKEKERERAERERLEKEKERERAERERLEKEILSKKLLELGIDPIALVSSVSSTLDSH